MKTCSLDLASTPSAILRNRSATSHMLSVCPVRQLCNGRSIGTGRISPGERPLAVDALDESALAEHWHLVPDGAIGHAVVHSEGQTWHCKSGI
jgi:hypothetical protein